LISSISKAEWSASCPGRFISRERDPDANWKGDWVGRRTGLDAVKRKMFPLLGIETPAIQYVAIATDSLKIQGYLFLTFHGKQVSTA
jgi:hypothetical protein